MVTTSIAPASISLVEADIDMPKIIAPTIRTANAVKVETPFMLQSPFLFAASCTGSRIGRRLRLGSKPTPRAAF